MTHWNRIHFLITRAAALVFVFLLFAGSSIFAASSGFNAVVNIVLPGKILFYSNSQITPFRYQEYDAYDSRGRIGIILVTALTDNYVEAKIVEGDFADYEGDSLRFAVRGEQSMTPRPPVEFQGVEPIEKPKPVEPEPEPEKPVHKPDPKPAPTPVKRPEPRPAPAPIRAGRDSKATPISLNYLVLYESHSDKNNNDDYMYGMVSATKNIQKKVFGTLYYIKKHNLDNTENDSDILGITLLHAGSGGDVISLGYSWASEDDSTSGFDRKERALNVSASMLLKARPNYYYRFGAYYTDRKGDNGYDHTSYGPKVTADYKLGVKIRGRLTYTANYSSTYSAQISNQYGASLYKFLNSGKLTLEYIRVDKVYSTPVTGLNVEDDNVFRIGYMHYN